MKKIKETDKYVYFEFVFKGNKIKVIQDKVSKELLFDADDVIKSVGLGENVKQYFSSDNGLDFISAYKKKYPDKPIFGDDGFIQKIVD